MHLRSTTFAFVCDSTLGTDAERKIKRTASFIIANRGGNVQGRIFFAARLTRLICR